MIDKETIFKSSEWKDLYIKVNFSPIKEYLRFLDITYAEFIRRLEIDKVEYKGRERIIFWLNKPITKTIDGIEYRYVPDFVDLLVSEKGELYSIDKKSRIKIFTSTYDYPHILCKSLYYKNIRIIYVHRIVALGWLENKNFSNCYAIDHIDNNKSNFHVSNLRWVSDTENNNFMIEDGLLRGTYPVKLTNIDTGETRYLQSMTSAANYMGRSRINLAVTPNYKGKIWITDKGRYTLDLMGIENNYMTKKDGYDKILVNINGIDRYYPDIETASIDLLGHTNYKSLQSFINNLKTVYKESTVEFIDEFLICASNGIEVYSSTSIDGLYKKIENIASKSTIKVYVNREDTYKGWKFWKVPLKSIEPTNKPMKITLLDIESGTEHTFDSLRSVSKYLGIDKKTTVKYLNKNKLFNKKYVLKNSPST